MELETITNSARKVFSKIGLQIMVPSKSFINWDIATGLAWDLADASSVQIFVEAEEERKEFAQIYGDILAFVGPMISNYVETLWPNQSNPVFVFDRAEWIVVSIENIKNLLLPLSQDYWEALESHLSLSYPVSQKIMKKASEISITSELGFLVGYLSQKVLAQYDFGFPKTDGVIPGELFYFIEPNIQALENRFNLDPVGLRLWITLHEATHSFQFKAFPWLKNYINSLLQDYLKLVDDTIKAFKNEADDGIPIFSWDAGWWKKLLAPEHRELVRKIQALMSLIEGYSEHVMMQVGKRLPNYEEMYTIFRERRKRKTLVEQLLEKFIGFDLKVKQYALGEEFVTHVVQKSGIEFLNRTWVCEENLPTWEEIYLPDTWIKRMTSLQ